MMIGRVATRARFGEWAGNAPEVATGLSGAGTTQADATAISADVNVFSTVTASSGARLPAAKAGDVMIVRNAGANALLVYPSDSETVNGTTSFSVTNAKTAMFVAATDSTWFAILSA